MPLAAGSRLGSYEVLAQIGVGGMGEVYRAHDPKLGRDVAVKLLPRDLADDPDRRARMVREARAAASLNHPNVCTIYEVGEAHGQHFIAMEVIEGQPLSTRLAERRLSLEELQRIALQLADAVGHAHDRGIVHRDLKGANVMITPEGRVKVLDFGLAKRVSDDELTEAPTASGPLTRPHSILGTVPYMAPEQLRGQPADARSDVWALGVILFEMAAGARPFEGQTAFEMSASILNDTPRVLPEGVPASLQAVIGRCLEKEPARRYQRAGELRAALETARPDVASVQPARFTSRRTPWSLAVAAVVAVLALTGAAVWWSSSGSEPSSPGVGGQIQSIAVLPLDNLLGDPGEEYFVTGMHQALITDLARIGLQKVIAKPSADAFKGTKKTLREIGEELNVQGLVTGSVMRASDRIQITAQLVDAETGGIVWANRYERNAGDVLSLQNDVVSAIAREVRATLTPEQTARLATARPVNAAAHDAYLKGRSMFAVLVNSPFDVKLLEGMIQQLERSIELDPTYAPTYAALARTYVTASQMSLFLPKDTFPKAKAAAVKAIELDDTLADAHTALGEVLTWYDWDWAGAEREIRRALELSPDSTEALIASEVFLTLVAGRLDEAAQTSQRILTLDPLNPFSRVQPVWVAFFSRRHDESIRYAGNLLEVWPGNIMGPFFLASNYAVKKMPAEVAVECGKVMDILKGAYVMQVIGQCAWAYAAVGQTDEARRLLRIVERPPQGVWLDPLVMGNVYAALGEMTPAVEWLQRGLEERAPNMIYLKAGAPLDPARNDPRFQAIIRQMNFP